MSSLGQFWWLESEPRHQEDLIHGAETQPEVLDFFSLEARDYSSSIENKIILIDGEQLAELMIDHNIGVTVLGNYEIKRIDTDFFTEA